MTASTMWIKNNMLYYDQCERKLTEAEMKVKISLEKLSIPDWYLNKRSNPPKILNRVPIGSRESYWSSSDSKNSTLNLTTSTISVTDTIEREGPRAQKAAKDGADTGTYKISRHQKSPSKEGKREKSPSKEGKREKSPSKKEKLEDTGLPEVKSKRNISKTFPKVSPSRKIHNINIVLMPRRPPIKLSCDLEDNTNTSSHKYHTFKIKRQEKEPVNAENTDQPRTKTCKCQIDLQKPSRKIKNDNLWESNATNNIPKTPNVKGNFMVRAASTPKFMPVTLFTSTIIEESPKGKKVPSPMIMEKLSIFEDSSRSSMSERSFGSIDKPRKLSQSMGEKTESKTCQKISTEKNLLLGLQERNNAESPTTRFLNSKKKSIELENVLRSKQQPARERNIVRSIIETLAEKVSKSSLPRRTEVPKLNQNFVKTMVSTLEKAKKKNRRNDEDMTSCSESESKSCTTSVSPKDTDSSDTDQRSPTGSDDSNRTFDYDTLASSKASEKSRQDDDSVYWIPVSRCKLPRTSSLISMMSKLSANGQSPSVSPIKSDNEAENLQTPWGSTFKKVNGLSRKLFRIDETTVIDSGYSDKSDRSVIGCSLTENTLSEDTQTESGSESTVVKVRKSLRRRSILGATFRIQC